MEDINVLDVRSREQLRSDFEHTRKDATTAAQTVTELGEHPADPSEGLGHRLGTICTMDVSASTFDVRLDEHLTSNLSTTTTTGAAEHRHIRSSTTFIV